MRLPSVSASSYTNRPAAGRAVCAKLSLSAFWTLSSVGGSVRPSSTSSVTRRLFLASLVILSCVTPCLASAVGVEDAVDDGRPWPTAPRFFGLGTTLPLPFDGAFFGGCAPLAVAVCSGSGSCSPTRLAFSPAAMSAASLGVGSVAGMGECLRLCLGGWGLLTQRMLESCGPRRRIIQLDVGDCLVVRAPHGSELEGLGPFSGVLPRRESTGFRRRRLPACRHLSIGYSRDVSPL